jgi:hypothetical protein
MAKSRISPAAEAAWREYQGRMNDRLKEPLTPEIEKAVRLGFIAGYTNKWAEEVQERGE